MSASVTVIERKLTCSTTPMHSSDAEKRRALLLGCGGVGRAFLQRLGRLGDPMSLVGVANSRFALIDENGLNTDGISGDLSNAAARPTTAALTQLLRAGDVVIDATASEALAAEHADWLRRGIHVATANKQGRGGPLQRHLDIDVACASTGARYGDAATVGAGLPFLRTVRALHSGGDQLLSIAGLLSGTLGWLLDGYDGSQPFSLRVQQARQAGITEPDPRSDLSGEDVRRKLLILLRSAGMAIEASDIQLCGLLQSDQSFESLDREVAEAFARAERNNARLRFVARYTPEYGARVGLEAIDRNDPLANTGSNNALQLRTCRYDQQPIVVLGPGAGTEVTAAALLDDVRGLPAIHGVVQSGSV